MEKNFSPLEREIYNLTGLETKREYRFHPTREWRFDFAIPAVRVAIEVEGGVWNGGRHFRPEGYLRDMEKYNEAAACGWLVIRTIPSELLRVKTIQHYSLNIPNASRGAACCASSQRDRIKRQIIQ